MLKDFTRFFMFLRKRSYNSPFFSRDRSLDPCFDPWLNNFSSIFSFSSPLFPFGEILLGIFIHIYLRG